MDSILNFFKWKDVFSLLCATFGFFSIIEIFEKNFLIASFFLALAGIFDCLDGFVARRFSIQTEYGTGIDTVSDAIAFGVAPAVFIYFYALNFTPDYIYFYLVISIIIMCAGLMRLARYLCLAKENKYKDVYVGMPITFNALIIPMLYLLSEYLNFNLFFITLIFAYLMISTIKFRKRNLIYL